MTREAGAFISIREYENMHILVTNDDGVLAPGLLALVQAVRVLGEVTVLAPDRNWSASGHDVTYSGAVTAAMEAVIGGVPGIAVSLDSPRELRSQLDYQPAASIISEVVSWVMFGNHLDTKCEPCIIGRNGC